VRLFLEMLGGDWLGEGRDGHIPRVWLDLTGGGMVWIVEGVLVQEEGLDCVCS
jgi:hypothetical protein